MPSSLSKRWITEATLLYIALAQVFLLTGGAFAQDPAGGGDDGCKPSADQPLLIEDCPLQLLQPLGDQDQLEPEPGVKIFFTYFNSGWPWVIGTTCGIAVLQAVVGGIQVMISGSREKANEGKERIKWALLGLLMLALAGLILNTLNPLFYR